MMHIRQISAVLSITGVLVLLLFVSILQVSVATSAPMSNHAISSQQNAVTQERLVSNATSVGLTPVVTIYLPIILYEPAPCAIAPDLISPTNGSALDTLIPWFTVRSYSTSRYFLEINYSTSPTFIYDIHSAVLMGGPGAGVISLLPPDNLMQDTLYYWKAREECTVFTPPSAVYSFTTGITGTIPQSPTLISPINSAILTSPVTLSWTSVPSVISYELTVLQQYTPTFPGWDFYTVTVIPSTSLTLDLAPNGYYWCLRSISLYAYSSSSNVPGNCLNRNFIVH